MSSTRRWLLGLVLVSPVVCAVSEPARAQEDVQRDVYLSHEVTVDGARLRLESRGRLDVSADILLGLQGVFDELSELGQGTPVELQFDPNGGLIGIRVVRADGVAGGSRRTINATFERTEVEAGQFWLVLGDDRRFPIPPSVWHDASNAQVFQFTRRGSEIRIIVEGGQVVEAAQGSQEDLIGSELWERIQHSRRGDEVVINGVAHRFLSYNLNEIRASRRLPNGEFVGRAAIALRQIHSFDNPLADGRILDAQHAEDETPDETLPPQMDVLEQEGVEVGDTIGVGLESGQVVELTPTELVLRVWRSESWSSEERLQRSQITQVRRVELTSQWTQPLQGGTLHVRVKRQRIAAGGGLRFEVDLLHDVQSAVVAGAEVVFVLGGLGFGPDSEPRGRRPQALPTLYAGETYTVRKTFTEDEFQDGRVELVIQPRHVMEVTSSRAHDLIVASMRESLSVSLRGSVFAAAAANGSEDLLRLLIDLAIYPPEGAQPETPEERRGELPPNSRRAQARAALSRVLDAARAVIVQDLQTDPREVQRAALTSEGVVLRPLNLGGGGGLAAEHMGKLVELLGVLPGAMNAEVGATLFEVYAAQDALRGPILKAYRAQPAAAASALVGLAAELATGSSEDQVQAEEIARILRAMAGEVIRPLIAELRGRDIEVRPLEEALDRGEVEPSEVVNEALGMIVTHELSKRRRSLDRQVEQAQLAMSEGDWEGAVRLLEGVLEVQAEHKRALDLLSRGLVGLADAQVQAGLAGSAAALYERAFPLLGKKEREVRQTALAQLYLRAAQEATEGVVIRAEPHDVAAQVRLAKGKETLQGGPSGVPGWLQVQLGERSGYVFAELAERKGQKVQVASLQTPTRRIKGLLERVRELSQPLETQANEIEGRLLAREAMERYNAGDFKGALGLFQQARDFAPTDERLSYEKWAWIKANTSLLAGLGGLLVLAAGVVVMQFFSRPKRVKFKGEFKHYGKDRAVRERDLDVSDDGSSDGESP